MSWVIDKYKEVLLFALIFGIYTLCVQPDWSWIGYCCDLGDFWTTAEYGTLAHFPGNPVYSILSMLVIRIPISTEAWRLAFFLSTVPAVLTCILVFYSIKKQTNNSWAPFVGCLAIAGANVFVVQSIIVEVYAFSAFMATLAYFLVVCNRFRLAAVATGLCFCVHPFAAFPAIVFLIWSKELRRRWRVWIPCAIIPYTYTIATGLLLESLSTYSPGPMGMLQYVLGSLTENAWYWFSLPIVEIPEQMWLVIVAFVGALGFSIIPIVRGVSKKNAVVCGAALFPVIYFVGNAMSLTILHITIAIPFLAILAGLGMEKVKIHPVLIMSLSFSMLIATPLLYDIGRTVDEDLSAAQYYEQLDGIPDDSIIVLVDSYKDGFSVSGREATLIHIHNKEDGDVIPLYSAYVSDRDIIGYGNVGEKYRSRMADEHGIKTPVSIDVDKTRAENLWNSIPLIKEANPDRSVFYMIIPEDQPFMRVIVEYENAGVDNTTNQE